MHIFTHPACLDHNPPPDPNFFPDRLKVVTDAIRADRFSTISWHVPPAIAIEELFIAHTPEYVAEVLNPINPGKTKSFSHDTVATSGTAKAALYAASAAIAAATKVLTGQIDKAFCLVSPPGHHAEADAAGGFCFFNNIALAAITAQKKLHAKRVAVIDFDAHHGNGTQSLFWNYEDRLFISLHEATQLSGFTEETGAWNNVLNIPLPPKSSGDVFRKHFTERAVPKLQTFTPDALFVSAGFDMHTGDPLSTLRLSVSDYHYLGEILASLSNTLCQGRLVAVLEGGYNLDAIGPCAAAFISGLMGLQND